MKRSDRERWMKVLDGWNDEGKKGSWSNKKEVHGIVGRGGEK